MAAWTPRPRGKAQGCRSGPGGREPGTHLRICSGTFLSLKRSLGSSTGCAVKHWMSAGVKEPPSRHGRKHAGPRAPGRARPGQQDPGAGVWGPRKAPQPTPCHPCPHPREDTLARRVGDVGPRRGRALQLLGAGEGAQQVQLEVLAALVLLAPVDEHLVLGRERGWMTAGPRARASPAPGISLVPSRARPARPAAPPRARGRAFGGAELGQGALTLRNGGKPCP